MVEPLRAFIDNLLHSLSALWPGQLSLGGSPTWAMVAVLLLGVLLAAKVLTPLFRSSPTYIRRASLMTPAERAFMAVLDRAAGEHYRVMGKPRAADVLTVKGGSGKHRFNALRRIFGIHFDFALCDPESLRVRAVIELDDRSHQQQERRKGDAFKDHICKQAGLPLLRFPVSNRYGTDRVRREIDTALGSPVSHAPRRIA